MKTAWNYITLARHARPGEDFELTPLRLAAGIALFGALLFGPTVFARLVGI